MSAMPASESHEPLLNRPFAVTGLRVENYRGFSDLHEDSWQNVNVLVGVNGSGKSALLRAIAIGLQRYAERFDHGRGPLAIETDDVKRGASEANIFLDVSAEGKAYSQRASRNLSPSKALGSYISSNSLFTLGHELDVSLMIGDRDSLPVPMLYRVDRAILKVGIAPSKDPKYPQASAIAGALGTGSQFERFFQWFRDAEDLENERKARLGEYEEPGLAAVRTAVGTFLEGYERLRIERSPLQMVITKGQEDLSFEQLSDGEKTLIALIGDIARRLSIANPNSARPLEGSGVVMIDEVELHLHPSWQRRMVKRLPELFPKVQFFFTTHSAVVASSAPRGGLFLVRDGKIERKEAYGQDVALVLDELFDTQPRDEEVKSQVDAVFRAITLEHPDEAREGLRRLESLLGLNDPEVVRAKTRMRGLGLG